MLEVKLIINSPQGEQVVTMDGSLSVGRTNLADLALPDNGLSRHHATFERNGEEIWLFDENSTNGTFVNGERVTHEGVRLHDGDEVFLGNQTQVFVQIRRKKAEAENPKTESKSAPNISPETEIPKTKPPIPMLLIAAGASTLGIILLAVIAVVVASYYQQPTVANKKVAQPTPNSSEIPVAVIDPLRDDQDDVEALLELWEVQEDPLKLEDVRDVRSTNREELNVSQAEWDKQRQRARSGRGSLGGGSAAVPPELASRGLGPQRAKMAELGLINRPPPRDSLLPRDFTELVKWRLEGKLIEMPLATKDYVLDQIGTSAKGNEITIFNPASFQSSPVPSSSDAFRDLIKLASDFEGQKYNLGDTGDRVEFKRRLLRSISPEGKRFIEELSRGYREKFNFPLLITSLIRTLEYQYHLTQTNPNATRAPNPPHASGFTFDMAFNQMSGAEQAYIYETLARYEKAGKIDALFEARNCIHIFVYPDGKPPKM